MPTTLTTLLARALEARTDLIQALEDEGTDCYRLLQGVAEGRPGLTIDRYGSYLLAQTWREPLAQEDRQAIESVLAEPLGLPLIWRNRAKDAAIGRGDEAAPEGLEADPRGRELGLSYDLQPFHRGKDPLLFLDFRAGRRAIQRISAGSRVLNLFAYTCSAGLCAAAGGAIEVWNVDFSSSGLAVGEANSAYNELPAEGAHIFQIRQDVLPVLRQLAGLSVPLRRGKERSYQRFDAQAFDLIVLDPPTWSTGPFGAIDIVRDYQGLFKPAVLATRPGGHVLATHHSAKVGREEWTEQLERCAIKAGRPLESIEHIQPDSDFPSLDGQPPLKMLLARVS